MISWVSLLWPILKSEVRWSDAWRSAQGFEESKSFMSETAIQPTSACYTENRICHFLLAYIQLILIHGPNVPGSYTTLFFTALDLLSPPDTPTTEHCFCFGPATSFFLQLFITALHSSPVTHGTPSNMQWRVWRGKRRGSIVSWRTEYRVHKLGDWSPFEVRVKWTWTARKFQGFAW